MELGGAETSLLGLLQSIDYTEYTVDLMLLEVKGELLPLLPKEVHLLYPSKEYQCLVRPMTDLLCEKQHVGIMCARVIGRILGRKSQTPTYEIKQIVHKLSLPFLPDIPGDYDLAISFIDPHYIIENKVNASITMGWLHTDFSRIKPNIKRDHKMWDALDYIVHISKSCKRKFDAFYPDLADKSIVIENVISKSFIKKRAQEKNVKQEMPETEIRLLSIGRFSKQKNFDNVPEICKLIRSHGLNVKWYLIGYGGEEETIRKKIIEQQMEQYVIILGKRDNPYPYICACDLYVQPSRYEGKCVAVREAQILEKPVVITRYATSESQLEDGIDGIIVPMDNKSCAEGIAKLLMDKERMKKLKMACAERDYTNADDLKQLYKLL